MNGIGSKRPADADAGNNAPAPASAKRPKKSAEVPEDQQDASWSTVMTPELVGTVARFLDLGTPSRPDLTNLCLVVGKVTSRVVRKMYLSGNEWYLSHLCRIAYMNKEHTRQAGMESWLEYNPDWWNRCVGAKSEKNVYSIALDQDVVKGLLVAFKRSSSIWVLERSCACCDVPELPSGLEFGIGDALLSVGGVDVRGMKKGEFHKIFQSLNVVRDGKIVLKYLPVSIRLFSDPLMATRYDLLAPLKHLVETGAVGVNEGYISDDTYFDEKENLIWFTLKPNNISDTCKCFENLLAVEGIDVNTEDPHSEGQRPIHSCAQSSDVFGSEALRLLVDSRIRTSLELNIQDDDGWTAIHYTLSSLDKSVHRAKMSKLKILLEAGADPNLRSEMIGTPEEFLLGKLGFVINKEKELEIFEMVGMLRCYTLRRRENET